MGLVTVDPSVIWTIGHSTLALEEFIDRLRGERIGLVADVRRYPGSRMYPHFNAEALEVSLGAAGIAYRSFPDLGGRRVARPDSTNTRWRNASFRGYADYMQTAEFEGALARLMAEAAGTRTAIMCAEAPWWRCHRALIADTLKARGVEVMHIMGADKAVPHPYTTAASIVDGRLDYGPPPGLFG